MYERGESAEDTIMGRFSIDGVEEGSVGIELTVVNCAGCLTECGWKIVNPHCHIIALFFFLFFSLL